ncbi:MAG: hypothetical protein ACT4N4_09065 [Rhodospirillales bacterium]
MTKIKTIAIAGAISIIALVSGFAGPAAAQAWVDYKTGELLPAVAPADQRGGYVQEAYGDVLGRPAGEENGLIGLLNQEKTANMPTDRTPADQRGGYVNGAYGDVLGRDAKGKLGSLQSLGSVGELFSLSRGDNGGAGKLLPAVQKPVTGAADKALLPAVKPGDGSDVALLPAVKPGNGGTNVGLLPAVLPAAGAGGGSHVAPGAVKGLNFTNTGRR